MHESHLMWMPGQARGQSSCSSLGRLGGPRCLLTSQHFYHCCTMCLAISWVTLAHVLGAGGWHIAAASAIPCLTARGTWTAIPKMWHRHCDKLKALGREVTPPGSQQSRASHAAPNSPAREHCSCYPLLLCNLFVLRLLFFFITQIVVNIKASPAARTHLHTLLRTCTSDCKELTVEVLRYFKSL